MAQMNQPRLYLAFVRHGEYQQSPGVPSALQPYALTKFGSEQAFESAFKIQQFAEEHDCDIESTLVSSPLLRAWQTADYIGQGLHIPYQIRQTEALVERSVGAVANLTIKEIETVLQADPRHPDPPENWKSDSHYRLPFQGAESLMEAGQRVSDEITRTFHALTQKVEKDTVQIMVGHGASFRHAAHLLGLLEFNEIAQLSMFYGVPIFFEYHPDKGWQKVSGEWKIRQKHLQNIPEPAID